MITTTTNNTKTITTANNTNTATSITTASTIITTTHFIQKVGQRLMPVL